MSEPQISQYSQEDRYEPIEIDDLPTAARVEWEVCEAGKISPVYFYALRPSMPPLASPGRGETKIWGEMYAVVGYEHSKLVLDWYGDGWEPDVDASSRQLLLAIGVVTRPDLDDQRG